MGNASSVKSKKQVVRINLADFRKHFYSDWDSQFLGILFICIFVQGVVAYILSTRPIPEYSDRQISQMQERFANFILGESVRPQSDILTSSETGTVEGAEEVGVEEAGGAEVSGEGSGGEGTGAGGEGEGSGTGEGEGEGGSGGTGGRLVSRVAGAEARRLMRESISRDVSNRGLLGLLTGTGSATRGEAVSSIVSGTGSGGGVGEDLDQVLANVDGLKTQGSSGLGGEGSGGGGRGTGGGVRGERSGRQATIDDLVSDLSTTRSHTVSRKGELSVEAPAEVEGSGRKSVYRSPDAIQEILLRHVPAIRYCYERELKRFPDLKGKITVRITVAPDGSVKQAVILTSTLNNDRVERCILARIRLWKDFKPIDVEEGDVSFRQVYAFGY